MGDYGEAGREFEDAAHQGTPDVDADGATVYATEPVGEATVTNVPMSTEAAETDARPPRPDGGQTDLDDWRDT
jgi:hypothetical protein